ncbi:hypothetical protein F2Q68_00016032 [Brassica cretica]|uniref:Uncharacterized protein n=1 Tax=Brassica cretica TaxID=69181 RepID=A0A8S9HEZ2_BRACR|nr:hypothetical protein F2Q68_00016032 [Brassica cretica]
MNRTAKTRVSSYLNLRCVEWTTNEKRRELDVADRERELSEIVYLTREGRELFLLRSGREQAEADIQNVSCPS